MISLQNKRVFKMIIGVAIRNEFITIMLPKPNRHVDCFKYATSLGIDVVKSKIGIRGKDQGFYTHTGKYLDRFQALKYAKRIKQPTNYGGIESKGALISEEVW